MTSVVCPVTHAPSEVLTSKCRKRSAAGVEHQPADIVALHARPVAIGMGVTAELTAVETAQSVVGSEPDESHRVLNDAIDVIG